MVFMIRSAFVATGLALVVVSATALSQQPSPQPVPTDPGALTPGVAHQVTLHLGDSVVVDGVPIGCQVTRRNQRVVIAGPFWRYSFKSFSAFFRLKMLSIPSHFEQCMISLLCYAGNARVAISWNA